MHFFKKIFFAVLSSCILLSLLNCSGGGGGGDSSGGGTNTPAPTTGTFQLTNNTSYAIHALYMSTVPENDWGPARNATAIPTGYTFNLTDIPPDDYDVAAVIYDDVTTYFAYMWGISITAGGMEPRSVSNNDFSGTLIVINGSFSDPITALSVCDSGGYCVPTQLASTIDPLGTFQVRSIPPGVYEVQAIRNGTTYTFSNLTITSLSYTTQPI